MPKYRVTGPDGATYEVTAPAGASEQDVMAYVQQNMAEAANTPPPVSARQAQDASMAEYEANPPDTARVGQSLQEYAKDVYGFKDYAKGRGTILPFGENADGSKEFATPEILKEIATMALLPGHASRGGSYTPTDALTLAALVSPVSTASRAGATMIPSSKTTHVRATPKVPTNAELKAASSQGYKRAGDLGVDYTSKSVKSMADDIVQTLEAEGRIAELNPELFALLNKLRNPPGGSVASLKSLDAFRRRLGSLAEGQNAAAATNPLARSQADATRIVRERLDRFLENVDPASVVARPAPPTGVKTPTERGYNFAAADRAHSTNVADEAARTLREARGNAAANFRSERLTGVADDAGLQAAAANSGKNLGNALRQRLRSLLNQPRKASGFSKEELEAIRQVVEGTATTNTLRRVSNLLGGGGGLGQTLLAGLGAAGGSATGSPTLAALGAAAPIVIGSGARSAANRLTARELRKVDKLVRSRSPLYASRLKNPGLEVKVPEKQAAAARMLIIQSLLDDDYGPLLSGGQ